MTKTIPESKWRWFGNAGHFICGRWCQFHLCTKVGKYLVSTVGEYFPPEGVMEINAKVRGIELVGKGDARRADYMRKIGFETLGSERTFETMVFGAGAPCKAPDCKCGLPSIETSELDFFGSTDAVEATKGHYRLCRKWAKKS